MTHPGPAALVRRLLRWRRSRPAVSIVVPVFNKARYLEACLKSLRSQSLSDIEIICIDDASTDGSSGLLEAWEKADSRIRLAVNRRNLGAAESRNLGMELARGEYVRFVDADDLLPIDSTGLMFERALKTGAEAVRGSLALFRGDDSDRHHGIVSVPDRTVTTLREEPALWIPWWHTSYLFSRAFLRRHGLTYPALRQGEDPVFVASALVRAERISLIGDVVYLYRKYAKTEGSAGRTAEALHDVLHHAKLVKALFQEHCAACWAEGYGPYLLEDFRRILARCQLNADETERIAESSREIWGEAVRLTR